MAVLIFPLPTTHRPLFPEADFFNIFNHVNFADPSLDLSNPAGFGVITEQFIPANRISGSRSIQVGMRLEF